MAIPCKHLLVLRASATYYVWRHNLAAVHVLEHRHIAAAAMRERAHGQCDSPRGFVLMQVSSHASSASVAALLHEHTSSAASPLPHCSHIRSISAPGPASSSCAIAAAAAPEDTIGQVYEVPQVTFTAAVSPAILFCPWFIWAVPSPMQ